MSNNSEHADYLGDGVYADFDGYQIELKTLEGNVIYLEPNVLDALDRYRKRIGILK